MMLDLAGYFPNADMVQAGYVLMADAPNSTKRVTWAVSGDDAGLGGQMVIFGLCNATWQGKPACGLGDQYIWAPDAQGTWYVWTITVPQSIRTYPRFIDSDILPTESASRWIDPRGQEWEYMMEVSVPGKGNWPFPPIPALPETRYMGITVWRPVGAMRWLAAEVFEVGDVPMVGGGYASGLRRFQHWDAVDRQADCEGIWYPNFGGVCLAVDELYRWKRQ